MSLSVPFLTRDYIEAEAEGLLVAYGEKFQPVKKPPVPADDILETYLQVTFDFDDLPALLGIQTDVFGATWIEPGQVIIDQSLDPTDHPERIGRYNFTVGHETGHWQLHRPLLVKDSNQQTLFEQKQDPPIVCRSSQAREPIEWQADFFAGCLLMPKAMLRESWRMKRNGLGRLIAGELRGATANGFRVNDSDDALIERFVEPLAREFAVSPIAMRIRLEELGFVVRDDVPALFRL